MDTSMSGDDAASADRPSVGEAPQSHVVLDADDMRRVITRISHEILEKSRGAQGLVILGIPTRGVELARRIADRIAAVEGIDVPVGSVDPTMYRDDLRARPARALQPTQIPAGGIDGKVVVLVDDVLYSGRTVRAALDALNEIGRPRAVRLAVLIDRGHRDLPIRADHVGRNVATAPTDSVKVSVIPDDERDAVVLHTAAAGEETR